MTSISDIRSQGTTILVPRREILEPLTAPPLLREHLGRFEDNYDLSTSSHIYRFLVGLCGEAGAGSLKRALLFPKLQSGLESTHFSDLDQLYGKPLYLPRLNTEVYSVDPRNEVMTHQEWQDVLSRDSSYRARCLTWMRALLEGPTKRGIALAAEAASGVECDVYEWYQYLDNAASDIVMSLIYNMGQTTSRQEFVIIPRTTTLTEADRRRIMRLVDRIRPVNSIPSVYNLAPARASRAIRVVESTSDLFFVSRLVTGRPDVTWPPVDAASAFWIESLVEKEAPTFAFLNSQETATFLSIVDSAASSEHVGVFNPQQSAFFSNLQGDDPLFIYDSSFAYSKAFAPITVSQPWMRGYEQTNDMTLVNKYYPLEYFAQSNISQLPINDPTEFWASEEQYAPSSEWLTLDFGSERPFNYLDLEVTQKPIDFVFEYWDSGSSVWVPLAFSDVYEPKSSVIYIPSLDNPWTFIENHFDRVITQRVRITMNRRDEAFPFVDSDPIRWSVEIRNLHAAHTIVTADDWVEDSGVDILGNSYRTDLTTLAPGLSSGSMTYWQSQPNPVPNAVEALYFDLRTNSVPGTMANLDGPDDVEDFDTRSMADMETFFTDAVVIDEIYIDPITFGPSMHFYYSNDTTPEWDQKLWSPVPQSYRLKKGLHALPLPTTCRFVKIEFSELVPAPYQTLEYPTPSEITYRKFPSWVQNEFSLTPEVGIPNPFDRVTVDPLTFGFLKKVDTLDSSYGTIRIQSTTQQNAEDEVRAFISTVTDTTPADIQADMESRIDFNSSFLYQQDLLLQLDDTRALSRMVLQNESSINAELPPFVEPEPDTQSIPDLTEEQQNKQRRVMFFPNKCRHQYQMVRGTNTQKLAYFVGINAVTFYRRNFAIPYDEASYTETLDDTAHIEFNDFTQDEFGYVITP